RVARGPPHAPGAHGLRLGRASHRGQVVRGGAPAFAHGVLQPRLLPRGGASALHTCHRELSYSRTAARSFALRARGLCATSSAEGTTGLRVRLARRGVRAQTQTGSPGGHRHTAPDSASTKRFTIRSSSEWNARPSRLPPG